MKPQGTMAALVMMAAIANVSAGQFVPIEDWKASPVSHAKPIPEDSPTKKRAQSAVEKEIQEQSKRDGEPGQHGIFKFQTHFGVTK